MRRLDEVMAKHFGRRGASSVVRSEPAAEEHWRGPENL